MHLDNTGGQTGDAYHQTVYASLNLVYQYHRRLSIGLEDPPDLIADLDQALG